LFWWYMFVLIICNIPWLHKKLLILLIN